MNICRIPLISKQQISAPLTFFWSSYFSMKGKLKEELLNLTQRPECSGVYYSIVASVLPTKPNFHKLKEGWEFLLPLLHTTARSPHFLFWRVSWPLKNKLVVSPVGGSRKWMGGGWVILLCKVCQMAGYTAASPRSPNLSSEQMDFKWDGWEIEGQTKHSATQFNSLFPVMRGRGMHAQLTSHARLTVLSGMSHLIRLENEPLQAICIYIFAFFTSTPIQ